MKLQPKKLPPKKLDRPDYKKPVIGGTVLTAFVLGCIWGMGTLFAPPQHKVGSPSGLQVNWDELDFGTAWSQSVYRYEVEVTNASSVPIGPVNAKAFCGCTAVEPEQFRLAPGEAVPLVFTLDLASQLNHDTGKSETQPFQVGVRLSQRDGSQLLRFDIRGSIRRLLTVPNVIQLQREYSPSKGVSQAHLTRIFSAIPLRRLTVACNEEYVDASISPSPDMQDWLLEVDLKPASQTLKPGPFEIPLWLRPIAKNGEELPSTKVMLRGSVARNYQVRPERLDFFGGNGEDRKSQRVVIESALNHPFTIEIDSPESLVVAEETSGSKTRHHFKVSPRMEPLGRQSMNIALELTDQATGNTERLEIRVRLLDL